MKRFVVEQSRTQGALLPERLDDFVSETNPVRVIDVFVDELDLRKLGFAGVDPAATGRPAYHPAALLKLYIYGYLNRIQSSRCLEREAQRNLELMWLVGRLTPDFKTIANFRKDNPKGRPHAMPLLRWRRRASLPGERWASGALRSSLDRTEQRPHRQSQRAGLWERKRLALPRGAGRESQDRPGRSRAATGKAR